MRKTNMDKVLPDELYGKVYMHILDIFSCSNLFKFLIFYRSGHKIQGIQKNILQQILTDLTYLLGLN